MMLTNSRLVIHRPAQILDHGVYIPDLEQMEDVPAGRWSVQPAGGREDLNRAITSDTEYVAYGSAQPVISADEEVSIYFDDGSVLSELLITAPPARWVFPGVGLSHTVLALKRRAANDGR